MPPGWSIHHFVFFRSHNKGTTGRAIINMWSTILGDPGAVSRVRKKGAKKVFKHGQKSLWIPTHQIISNQTVKRMLAPDWAQKTFVSLCPIGEQNLMSSFRVFVHDGYCLARKKKEKQNPQKIDWVPIQTQFPQKITKTLPLLRELSDASCMSQHVLRHNWLEIQLRNKLVHLVPDWITIQSWVSVTETNCVIHYWIALFKNSTASHCIFRRVLNSTLNYDEFGKQYTQWLWNHIFFQCG